VAHSLERRWAKLVQSYARLKEHYDKSLQREALLASQLREARAEVRELRRDRKEYMHASRNSFEKLLATTRYAIAHLYEARDLVAAEKMEIWLEDLEENIQPVTNVMHLIELLEEWMNAMPCDDPEKVAVTWMKTNAVIRAARGTDGGGVSEANE
jgi:hypothetical protein